MGKKFKFFVTARRHIHHWKDHVFKRLILNGGYEQGVVEAIRAAYTGQ
jgi:hypothetical protein